MQLDEEKQIRFDYSPTQGKPMSVLLFGSGSGSNLEALLEAQDNSYKISALFTDRKCRIHEIAARENIPLIYNSFKKFSGSREQYDEENVRLIEACGITFDLVVLAGYMRLLTAPLLQKFPNKIINVHPANLSKHRKYVGADAVYDALIAGETRTRSSVIIVDENVDTGPLIMLGPWVDYTEGHPITREKATKHQSKQKTESDFPAIISAVKLIAQGE